MTPIEFLHARIDEEEQLRLKVDPMKQWHSTRRVIAECAFKRAVLKVHESWPVLIKQPLALETVDSADGHFDSVAMRMSQQIGWFTTAAYRNRFGDEPPTTPILGAMLALYADHPDYDQGWV